MRLGLVLTGALMIAPAFAGDVTNLVMRHVCAGQDMVSSWNQSLAAQSCNNPPATFLPTFSSHKDASGNYILTCELQATCNGVQNSQKIKITAYRVSGRIMKELVLGSENPPYCFYVGTSGQYGYCVSQRSYDQICNFTVTNGKLIAGSGGNNCAWN